MNVNVLIEKIKGFKNREKLNTQKRYNYELAKNKFNWEKESEILVSAVGSL